MEMRLDCVIRSRFSSLAKAAGALLLFKAILQICLWGAGA